MTFESFVKRIEDNGVYAKYETWEQIKKHWEEVEKIVESICKVDFNCVEFLDFTKIHEDITLTSNNKNVTLEFVCSFKKWICLLNREKRILSLFRIDNYSL